MFSFPISHSTAWELNDLPQAGILFQRIFSSLLFNDYVILEYLLTALYSPSFTFEPKSTFPRKKGYLGKVGKVSSRQVLPWYYI